MSARSSIVQQVFDEEEPCANDGLHLKVVVPYFGDNCMFNQKVQVVDLTSNDKPQTMRLASSNLKTGQKLHKLFKVVVPEIRPHCAYL